MQRVIYRKSQICPISWAACICQPVLEMTPWEFQHGCLASETLAIVRRLRDDIFSRFQAKAWQRTSVISLYRLQLL